MQNHGESDVARKYPNTADQLLNGKYMDVFEMDKAYVSKDQEF